MPMPIFRRKVEQDADGYRQLDVPAGEITSNQLTKANISGQTVLITRLNGELYAFSNICPHAAADLSQGRFSAGLIKCPDHGYTFDIRSGRAVWPEDEVCRLLRFSVKTVAGEIWIKIR